MKRILAVFGATTMLTAPAFAGSMSEPVVEPAPVAPAAPMQPVRTGGDWTGAYGGLQFGNLSVDGDVDGDDTVYGVHAGYDYDFGQFVLGGEIDYDTGEIDLGSADLDSVTRLKLRGGYDFGSTLVYATAGGARADTSIGDADGPFGGLGVAYKVTDNFEVGGEVLRHSFEDIGDTSVDADATSISLRGSYRF